MATSNPNVTRNADLRKRIGMHREDTDFNRRAAQYADGAMKLARGARAREKATRKLNEERLRDHD